MQWTRLLIVLTTLVLILNQTSASVGAGLLAELRWVCLGLFSLLFALRQRTRNLHGFDIVAIGFLLFALASTVYSDFPDITSQRAASAALLYVAVFWVIWDYVDRAGEGPVINILIGVIGFSLIFGFIRIFGGADGWQNDGRFQGIFNNPNSLALTISIILPLILWRYFEFQRKFDIALLIVLAVSLLLSQSRNGILASTIGIAYLVLRIKGIKFGMAIMFGMVALYAYVSLGRADGIFDLFNVTGDFSHLFYDSESLRTGSGRVEVLDAIWPLIMEQWLGGYGFGTEEFALNPDDYYFEQYFGGYLHNSYVGLTYQLGVIGAILFYAPLFIFIVRKILAPNKQGRSDTVGYAYESVILAGLMAALFESWIYSVGNAFSFPFWICVMLATRRSVMAPMQISRTAPTKPTPGGLAAPRQATSGGNRSRTSARR